MNRWSWERAVLRSQLPPEIRHVLLTLAVYADWPGGTTPAEHTPSLTTLADTTGLARSTVCKYLLRAEQAGWISRDRPTIERARVDKERTRYALKDPTGAVGLVRDTDQASPRHGLVPTSTSPPHGLGLVRDTDTSQTASRTLKQQAAIRIVTTKTDATEAEAVAVVEAIARDRPDIRNMAAVLTKFEPSELTDRLSAVREEARRSQIRQWLDRAKYAEPCDHGQPGGHLIRPDTRQPLCASCRARAQRSA